MTEEIEQAAEHLRAHHAAPYREERMATPMPPSLRRSYRGQSKRSKAQRARKGIPPWKLR